MFLSKKESSVQLATVMRRGLPVAFRLYALGSRFIFVFVLARYLLPADVGSYGLMTATVAYVVYALGMDMYTYTTREVIAAEPTSWRSHIASHFAFLALVACVVLPLAVLIFTAGLLPWGLIGWFYIVLVTEHVGYEVDRLLVAVARQFDASIVILIRQALLPTVMVPLLVFATFGRSLDLVFALWAGFNAVAIIVGVVFIIRRTRVEGSSFRIDWGWIGWGMRTSLPFLVGTLCLRFMFTADRQVVGAVDGLDVLAVYTLAMTVANGMGSVLSVGVHQFAYPNLVKKFSVGDHVGFARGMKTLWLQTIGIVVIVWLVVFFAGGIVTSVLREQIYVEYWWLVPTAVLTLGLFNFSMVPHYGLYAMRADRSILFTTIIGTAAFLGGGALGLVAGLPGAASALIGLTVASAWLLLGKYVSYRRGLSRVRAITDLDPA
jgi:O-antigen/teichoic acid export membrane protein